METFEEGFVQMMNTDQFNYVCKVPPSLCGELELNKVNQIDVINRTNLLTDLHWIWKSNRPWFT